MGRLAAVAIATAVTVASLSGAPSAEAATGCQRKHAVQTVTVGRARQAVTVDVWSTVCPRVTTVETAAATSGRPVLVRSAELWRYTKPRDAGAVRVAAIPVPRQAAPGIPIWVNRQVPTRRPEPAGYVRVTVTADGGSKVVTVAV